MRREYLDGSWRSSSGDGLPTGFVLDRLRTRIGEGQKRPSSRQSSNFRTLEAIRPWLGAGGQSVGEDRNWPDRRGGGSEPWALVIESESDRRGGCKQTAGSDFIYKTTPGHVEEGEERFEVFTSTEKSNAVWYETEAVSRPRHLLALLGYPVTRRIPAPVSPAIRTAA